MLAHATILYKHCIVPSNARTHCILNARDNATRSDCTGAMTCLQPREIITFSAGGTSRLNCTSLLDACLLLLSLLKSKTNPRPPILLMKRILNILSCSLASSSWMTGNATEQNRCGALRYRTERCGAPRCGAWLIHDLWKGACARDCGKLP